ncbi:SDR family oxidoreductase [Actinomadura vinacea]|uniref:SDR family oxidoreductase n=1 Tax=Actinomadura vinacea TaxID=115336 RepID=A0ABP5VUH1_9ACTN
MGNNTLSSTPSDAAYVAVTGGSGFVGGNLVSALTDLGKQVVIVDLAEPPAALSGLPGVQFRRTDLRDYGETLLALRDVDTVYHLAGNASGTRSVENPRFDFQMNGLATCNVGNACVELGVRRMVFMSSAIVYGTPQAFPMTEEHPICPFLPYGASKYAGELHLRSLYDAMGLPVVIGRSFVVYGPGEDPRTAGGEVSQFLRWQLNELPIPVVGDIDHKTRDFVHVADVCAALITLAESGKPGEAYNIGGGEEVSMRELAAAVGEATGRPARLQADASQLEDSFRLVADISKLRDIGYRPRVPLDQGLKSLAEELGTFPELPSVTVAFKRDPGT